VLTTERDYVELYRSTGVALWRAVYAYSGGRRDIADDAVAEAFARAIRDRSHIRRPESWLYRTAFRIAAAELRRSRAMDELSNDFQDAVASDVDMMDLLAALRKVSPNQRAAVYLHYFADLPIREVARRMGTSVAAVKVHLHRGRNRLRELLGAEEVDDV
jgi:RNA polymerase sigma-70 factor, ECF subfamily